MNLKRVLYKYLGLHTALIQHKYKFVHFGKSQNILEPKKSDILENAV